MAYTKHFITFIAGAAVGAIAGILLAPDKGSVTRQNLADKTDNMVDAIRTKFRKTSGNITETGISESGTSEMDREKQFS